MGKWNEWSLIDRCRWSWITYNGTTGCKVTGPSGKSIFLPGAGRKSDYGIYRKDSFGYYWSSSRGHGLNAYYLYFNEEGNYCPNCKNKTLAFRIIIYTD